MGNTKIMPRHLLLLALPIGVAILGGMLSTGSVSSFTASTGSRGFSQEQMYLAISLLAGLLAFSMRCLPKTVTYGLLMVFPMVYGILAMPQFGSKFSFLTLFSLNLGFTLGVWLSLRYIFFTRFMLRFRTAAFALVAAVLLSLYFKILFMALHMPLSNESWSGYFWNSLFLFIFIGFGLSVADVIIIRKEVEEERIRLRNQPIEEDEEEEDDGL